MKSVASDLADAITSPERVIFPALHVDWDNDGYNGDGSVDDLSNTISSVNITQTLTTNVPSSAQPVAGAAVASLSANLDQGHPFGDPRTPVVRNITTSSAATGNGTITITRPTVQPGDTVLLWIASPSSTQYPIRPGGSNAVWNEIMYRGDYTTANTHFVTGHLLVRRIPLDPVLFAAEPTTYTFKISSFVTWTAACVSVIGGYTPGIHKYSTKGLDVNNTATYTPLNATPVTVTLPGCLVLGFFAGWAGPAGATWTPTAPAVEIADTTSTSGIENAAISVTQYTGPPIGLVQMSATISVPTEPGVAAVVAFAPMQAGDDTQNAAWLYSELNPNSMLAGKQRDGRNVTGSIGFATRSGMQSVTVFTGKTLGVDVSSRSRRASLGAQDNRETMRPATVDGFLPPSVIAESPITYFGETLPYRPGLEATWLVSYLFSWCFASQASAVVFNEGARAGVGYFASYNIRPSTFIHIPCHGSLAPFVGYTRYAYQQSTMSTQTRVTFDRGPWVASTAAQPIGAATIGAFGTTLDSTPWDASGHSAGRIELMCRQTITGSGTIKMGVTGADTPTLRNAYINVAAGGAVTLTLAQNGGITRTVVGPTIPQDRAWHNLGVHWDSTTGSATFKLDTATTVTAFAAFTGTAPGTINVYADMNVTSGAQVAEIQVAGGYSISVGFEDANVVKLADPFMWDNFVPTAFIDRSENLMDSVLASDQSGDVWAMLSGLAEAEFAAVYFDADGYPHYRTRYSDLTPVGQTVQRQLTTLNALTDVDYQSGVDQLANQIQATFSPIAVTINAVAWQPSSPLLVPARSCVTVYATIPGLQLPTATASIVFIGATQNPDGTGFNTGGANMTYSGFVVGSQLAITICNGNGSDVYMVDTSGNPGIQFKTSWVTSGTTTLGTIWQDNESVRRHGPQPLLNGVSPSKWRQRQDSADRLARILLADIAEPKPVLTNVKIVGDPRLQLGDLVQFVDPDGLGFNGNYRLVGISPNFSTTDGFTQSLVARSNAGATGYGNCGVAIWDVSLWDDCSVWGP